MHLDETVENRFDYRERGVDGRRVDEEPVAVRAAVERPAESFNFLGKLSRFVVRSFGIEPDREVPAATQNVWTQRERVDLELVSFGEADGQGRRDKEAVAPSSKTATASSSFASDPGPTATHTCLCREP